MLILLYYWERMWNLIIQLYQIPPDHLPIPMEEKSSWTKSCGWKAKIVSIDLQYLGAYLYAVS